MRSFLKLMPLAIVAALAIVLAARAGSAGATPSSLTVNGSTSAATVTLSTAVPVVATYTDEGADLTLYSTAATSIGYFLSGPSITTNNDGQTLTPNATPATSITATDDTDTTAETTVLQAFFYCVSSGTTQIYFTQGGGASSQITVTCGSGSTTTLSVSPTSTTVGAAATVTGNCTAASQTLTASTGGYFSSAPTNGTYVSATQVNCAAAGSMVATFYCSSAATVTFTLNGVVAYLTCGSSSSGVTLSPSSTAVGSASTVTGTCTAAGQTLVAGTGGYFSSAVSNGTYVSSSQINCVAAGSVVATFYCSSTATVTFTLNGAVGYLYCGTSGSGVTVSPTSTTVGGAATITGTCTAAGQTLIASTGGYFTSAASNGTYVSATQINCVAAGSVVATFYCSSTATVTFSLNGTTGYLYCGTSGSSTVSVYPTTGTTGTITGTCTAGTLLTQTGPASITQASINGSYLSTGVAAGSVNCSTSGTLSATLVCNSAGSVYISLGGGNVTFTCSAGTNGYYNNNPYNNNPYGTGACGNNYGQPYSAQAYSPQACVSPTPAPAASLTVSSSSTSISCGGTGFVNVTVKNSSGGGAPDGTNVSLTTTMGSLTPTQSTTSLGSVLAVFTAPTTGSGGAATITAAAGSITGSTSLSINCTAATDTLARPPAATTLGSNSPAIGLPVISPPNTGDAGLKSNDSASCDEAATLAPQAASLVQAAVVEWERVLGHAPQSML